jgi:transposase
MPKPIPVPIRQKLWERSRRGEEPASLARAFGLSPRTVRQLLKRFRDCGPEALRPNYHQPKQLPQAYPAKMREAALALRRKHPGWGATLIRVALSEQQPQHVWPESRTLQRWFRNAGLGPAPPPQRPPRVAGRADQPHQTWQMDAAELIPLSDGTRVCWLRIVDEATGAVLKTTAFPPRALDSSRSASHAEGSASSLRAVGPPRAAPGGQRCSVGFAWGSAYGLGLLAGGFGDRRDR